jgi:hypothetical protein
MAHMEPESVPIPVALRPRRCAATLTWRSASGSLEPRKVPIMDMNAYQQVALRTRKVTEW